MEKVVLMEVVDSVEETEAVVMVVGMVEEETVEADLEEEMVVVEKVVVMEVGVMAEETVVVVTEVEKVEEAMVAERWRRRGR